MLDIDGMEGVDICAECYRELLNSDPREMCADCYDDWVAGAEYLQGD